MGSGEYLGWIRRKYSEIILFPEAHTDFIFAIIAEELGLMGTFDPFVLWTSYFSNLCIGFKAIRSELMFQGYLCISIGIWFPSSDY
ncbi:MAG: hypothetical protein CM1200mP17_11680 [Woeseia sp.]|nr:MAG: hypothetical protein CM1200mP17_11680 [Woeseia sp.]